MATGRRNRIHPGKGRHRLSCAALLLLLALAFPGTSLSQPLRLAGQVISADTTWSGEILIEGVVVVGRLATLTIAPGTRITFRRVDRNNDGIGDGEIRVLGRIIAEGRKDKPISFSSAEPEPAPKDWSYLLIFTSAQQNRLSWCEFHHGFSGLQVHFSSASVTHCTFTGNHEGLRFGRADLSIRESRFTGNDLGIRFTRMEGPVVITGNEISHNRIGILLVPSGQNIRDFFEPDRSGEPWNTGRLKVSGNNIRDNAWYNLDLGEKQFWDLEISGNYWGATDPDTIAGTIFDHRRDPALGSALTVPFATEPFPVGTGTDPGTNISKQQEK